MSIQSEITRISGNVSDALDAIEDKGVTVPAGSNSDDMAGLIRQITGGLYASGHMLSVNLSAAGTPVNSFITDIAPVQAGSGDPASDNVRPLKGFTQVDLPWEGRNLLVDNKTYPITHSGITTDRNADGSYQITGNKANSAVIFLFNFADANATSTSTQYDYKKWLPNGSYKVKLSTEGLPSGAEVRIQICGYNSLAAAPTLTTLAWTAGAETSFIVTDDYPFIMCRFYFAAGTYSNLNAKLMPMIYRDDETDTSWDTPRSSYPVSLGRTVYGGKLNATTGELTVTHALLELDGATTGKKFTGKSGDSGINEYYIASIPEASTYGSSSNINVKQAQLIMGGFYCSVAPVKSRDSTTDQYGATALIDASGNFQPRIRFLNSNTIQDVTAANSWLASLYSNGTPCTLCYRLREEYYSSYQLTPEEITTLLGKNNVWSTAGDIQVILGGGGGSATIEELNVSGSGTYTATGGVDGYSPVVVPAGTAGTPTASKGTVSNHSISVTPSVTNTTGFITGSTKTGTAVTVSASELVSGNKSITANGTNIDVANYSTVSVTVSGKNVQAYLGYASRQANSYGATNVTLTVAKTGTYKVSWCAWRSSSQGTMGTNLHIGSSSGTDQQTFTGTYGQCITLTDQSLTANTVLTLYATSGSTSRTIYVGNLIIEEQ